MHRLELTELLLDLRQQCIERLQRLLLMPLLDIDAGAADFEFEADPVRGQRPQRREACLVQRTRLRVVVLRVHDAREHRTRAQCIGVRRAERLLERVQRLPRLRMRPSAYTSVVVPIGSPKICSGAA